MEIRNSKYTENVFYYFLFYAIYGILVKLFIKSEEIGILMNQLDYAAYSTIGGSLSIFLFVMVKGWYRKLPKSTYVKIYSTKLSVELLYIIPSGICTAFIIISVNIIFVLPINIMAGMILIKAIFIIAVKTVDSIQYKLKISDIKVSKEENIAVLFAFIAIFSKMFFMGNEINNKTSGIILPITVLIMFVIYFSRLFIMNYYKNTRVIEYKYDIKSYFAIEQLSAFITLVIIYFLILLSKSSNFELIQNIRRILIQPPPFSFYASLSGISFGMVAFFSVSILLTKKKTATYTGLIVSLTSIIAGIAATLIFSSFTNGSFPVISDWVSLVFILLSLYFLYLSQKKHPSRI